MKSLATAVCLLFLAAPCACAQSWPAKPVRLILSQPPGSSPDIVARLIADRDLGIVADGAGTPEQLGEFIAAEHVRWAKLAKEIGVVAE